MVRVTPRASSATIDTDCKMLNRLPTRRNAGSATLKNTSTAVINETTRNTFSRTVRALRPSLCSVPVAAVRAVGVAKESAHGQVAAGMQGDGCVFGAECYLGHYVLQAMSDGQVVVIA